MERKNVVQEKSFNFAISIIGLYKELVEKKEYVISKQLLRSGTSIGANIEEATAGISKKDFIAKMSISSKEARETRYWLRLLQKSELVNANVDSYIEKVDELIKLLTSIVKSSQEKMINVEC